MSSPLDLLSDFMADAPLSDEQRELWRQMCAELVLARTRIQELETRLHLLSRDRNEPETVITLLNRPDFNREVARALSFDERYGGTSSIIYLNIENLDAIRQRHGPQLATAAAQCISDTLIKQVRRSDILGRMSTDEYGLLLPRCNNENAWLKAEKVANALFEALTQMWGPGLKPEISYGAYTFQDQDDIGEGIRLAAQSLTKLDKKQ